MDDKLVVHVVEHTLREVSGYSVRTHQILRALRRQGRNVLAIAPRAGNSGDEQQTLDGVSYLHVSTGSDTRTLAGHFRGLRHLGLRVAEEVRKRDGALVHAHSPARIGFAGLRAARAAGVPFLYEWRGLWEDAAVDRGKDAEGSVRYRLTRGLETYVLRRSDGVICLGRGMRNEARRRGVPEHCLTNVPNGVDTERFQPRAPMSALVERFGLASSFVIGYVGNLYRYEGVDILLRAFADLRSKLPQARLLLVGEGDLQSELRAWVDSNEMAQHVVLAGAVPHESVGDYYSVCDVLVYPRRRTRSTELVTPLKPLEPMAMARPVVVSRAGGLIELIGIDGAGMLCDADDPAALAATLLRVAEDDALRRKIAEQGCAYARERRWESVVDAYRTPYATLLARGR